MSEMNKALARLYFAKFPHDESLAEEALAQDFRFHHLMEIQGVDAFRNFMRSVSRAFPDFRFDLHTLVSEGQLVAAHYDFRGRQNDVFLNVVPSLGRAFSTPGMSLFRCDNHRIAEIWVVFHSLSMMQQLGAIQELQALRQAP
jgi:predicted ester cyclase